MLYYTARHYIHLDLLTVKLTAVVLSMNLSILSWAGAFRMATEGAVALLGVVSVADVDTTSPAIGCKQVVRIEETTKLKLASGCKTCPPWSRKSGASSFPGNSHLQSCRPT